MLAAMNAQTERVLYETVVDLLEHHDRTSDTERAWAAVRAISADPGDVAEALVVCLEWNAGRPNYAPEWFATEFPLWLQRCEITGSAAGDTARAAYRSRYGMA